VQYCIISSIKHFFACKINSIQKSSKFVSIYKRLIRKKIWNLCETLLPVLVHKIKSKSYFNCKYTTLLFAHLFPYLFLSIPVFSPFFSHHALPLLLFLSLFLFSFSSTDEQLQEMTSPANHNRYKEISRPNVNKIVKLGMAFRDTYVRSSWCVWERGSGDGEGVGIEEGWWGERTEIWGRGEWERRGLEGEESGKMVRRWNDIRVGEGRRKSRGRRKERWVETYEGE
jgi:hypothetical protein